MTSKNKSSNKLRKILDFKSELGTPRNIKKFAENMDIIVKCEQSLFLNLLWTFNFFSNNMHTFFFKFHNNTLGYNASVAHFVHGHSALCTFCNLLRNGEGGAETPLHLFYECAPVQDLIVNLFRQIMNDENFEITAREYFSTFERRDLSNAKNKALTYISKILIFFIWLCRNRCNIPQLEQFLDFFNAEKLIYLSQSKKFRCVWEGSAFQIL